MSFCGFVRLAPPNLICNRKIINVYMMPLSITNCYY